MRSNWCRIQRVSNVNALCTCSVEFHVGAGLIEVVRVVNRIRHSASAHARLPSPRAPELAAALATTTQALGSLASAASKSNVS